MLKRALLFIWLFMGVILSMASILSPRCLAERIDAMDKITPMNNQRKRKNAGGNQNRKGHRAKSISFKIQIRKF